jgi:ABC-type Zn uptake system ZnuABC Zn-binding protein ZnuA
VIPTAKPKTEAEYQRDARNFKQHLKELSAAVTAHLKALDMANDRVRYFALGVDYRKDRKR